MLVICSHDSVMSLIYTKITVPNPCCSPNGHETIYPPSFLIIVLGAFFLFVTVT